MRSRWISSLARTLIVLACCSFAVGQTPPRITQPLDDRRMATTKGNVSPLARPEFDEGALAADEMLHRVTIFFQRTASQQQALEKLLAEQQDPNSANYRN